MSKQTETNEREQLERDFEAATDRVDSKRLELEQARTDFAVCVDALVDAPTDQRPALLKKRAELRTLVDALQDEVTELERRRDVADVARFEFDADQAGAVVNDLNERYRASGARLNATIDEEHRFVNRGGRSGASKEADTERMRLATARAQQQTETDILKRDLERAAWAFKRAQNDLAAVRGRVGLPPAGERGDVLIPRDMMPIDPAKAAAMDARLRRSFQGMN